MKFSEKLKEKITSRTQWTEICNGSYLPDTYITAKANNPTWVDGNNWWASRELNRIAEGVYETTEQLEQLNKVFGIYAHISTKDRKMVAYTPDATAGERDAQIIISPGRLFTKFYPVASPEYVRNLTEEHNATACAEVEFLTGMAIVQAYNDMVNTGVGSCMTKTHWKDKDNPCEVYDAPGISLAILRDSAGKINARALVFENTSKRVYIRAYGNPALVKRLNGMGYKVGNFAGAKLKKVLHSTHVESNAEGYQRVLLPYLDANGSMSAQVGSSVVLLEDSLVVVNKDQLTAFRGYVAIGSTVGCVDMRPVPPNKYLRTCLVSAQVVDLLAESTTADLFVEFWDKESEEVGWALTDVVSESTAHITTASYKGAGIRAYAQHTVCVANGYSDTRRIVNSSKNLEYYDLVELDKTIYPEGGLHNSRELVKIGDKYYKQEDTLRIFDKGEIEYRLKSEVLNKANKSKYVRLHNSLYITAGTPYLVTKTGAKVRQDLHQIGWDVDGEVSFARGHVKIELLDRTWLFPMGTNLVTARRRLAHSPYFQAYVIEHIGLDTALDTWDSLKDVIVGYTRSSVSGHLVSRMPAKDRETYDFGYWGAVRQPPVMYQRMLASLLKSAINTCPISYVIGKQLDLMLSDADAIEYPNQLIEIPTQPLPEAALPSPEIEVA